MASLMDIEGIGDVYYHKLRAVGIGTTDGLLERGASPKGRAEIAEQSGISEKLILEWVNHADLFRVKGVGSEYSDLLEEAGVDTIPELAQRNPDNLYQKLVEVNQAKHLVRRLPTPAQVKDWVAQAGRMPRVITY
jgi:predicted flap endonuclease-1-like 5' DNA nuclease